jgi:hypothetical protein
MAEQKVGGRAEALAREAGRSKVSEKEMVDAFFLETPFGFQGMMKDDLKAAGIDYVRYGHPEGPGGA